MRISSIMFHSILLLGCAISFSLGLHNLKKRHSTEHRQNQSEPFTPPPHILEGLKDLTSSRIVLANTVLMGTFYNYNDKLLPGLIIAMFKLELFYKNRFGISNERGRFILVIDYTNGNSFHCFKYMNKSSDYIIYLNGSGIKVGLGKLSRSYYWVSSKPQEATRLRVKKVIEFTCSDCPSPPAVKLSTSIRNINELRFKCQSNSICNLPVKVFWFKHEEIIKDQEHEFNDNLTIRSPQVTTNNLEKYSIENHPSYSVLIVKDITGDHNIIYRCIMMNLIGLKRLDFAWPHLEKDLTATSQEATHVTVDKKLTLYILLHFDACDNNYCTNRGQCLSNRRPRTKWCLCFGNYHGIHCKHWIPATETIDSCNTSYCLNNARCNINSYFGKISCMCFDRYYGAHCQYIVPFSIYEISEGKSESSPRNYIFNTIFTFGLFFIFISVFCLILAFQRLKKQLFTYTGSVMVKPVDKVSNSSKNNQLTPNTPKSSLSPPHLFKLSYKIEPQKDKVNLD